MHESREAMVSSVPSLHRILLNVPLHSHVCYEMRPTNSRAASSHHRRQRPAGVLSPPALPRQAPRHRPLLLSPAPHRWAQALVRRRVYCRHRHHRPFARHRQAECHGHTRAHGQRPRLAPRLKCATQIRLWSSSVGNVGWFGRYICAAVADF
ncbi:hypothetical protein FIBSPDRAFT_317365 [Athelia psychrophila]|uniref:Uncharacterized protein n=1 Tax=Athelia psychrophila TaxID=1759441 RepID=A0A167WVW9_9AGAM|nr:hypothetical protein FIBSPDRAFT_317365 [Fibularhizoctonia sp. CBS 109695]